MSKLSIMNESLVIEIKKIKLKRGAKSSNN